MKKKLVEWIDKEIEKDKNITTLLIREQMLKEMKILHPDQLKMFEASRGWLTRFMKRNDYVKRKITSTGRGCPRDFKEQIKEYLGEAFTFANQFRPEQIIAFDQMSMYMEMVGNYTIRKKGNFTFF